jgi:hypothetical protein
MIRYSAYHTTNHHMKRSAECSSLCLLEAEYRELQDLRARVRSAEAVANLRKPGAADKPTQERGAVASSFGNARS